MKKVEWCMEISMSACEGWLQPYGPTICQASRHVKKKKVEADVVALYMPLLIKSLSTSRWRISSYERKQTNNCTVYGRHVYIPCVLRKIYACTNTFKVLFTYTKTLYTSMYVCTKDRETGSMHPMYGQFLWEINANDERAGLLLGDRRFCCGAKLHTYYLHKGEWAQGDNA